MVSSYLEELIKLLDDKGLELYIHMPVPGGYGKRNTLDYILCIAGHYVAIETKAPGEDLTPLQRQVCRNLFRSGATIFIISSKDGLDAFKNWVKRNERWIFDRRCY